jgi:DNA repair ATPase RecN
MAALIELRAENFKRLHAVELKLNDNGNVIIAGRNAQGKSSVLDAIVAALCGKSSIDQVPVRVGEDEATIEAMVSTEPPLRIRRVIKPDGKTTLTITQMTGEIESKVSKPQQTLDALVGKVAFDPLAFTRMRPNEQMTLLKGLVGVSTDEIDTAIEQALEQRKLVNRDIDQLKGQLDGMHEYKSCEPVDVADLMREIDEVNIKNDRLRQDENRQSQIEEDVYDTKNEIAELEGRIDALRSALHEKEAAYIAVTKEIGSREYIDTEPIREQINQAGEINRQVQTNREREQVSSKLRNAKREAETYTKSITDLRSRRLALMDSASWPVGGLGFGAGGVTFNGLPFSQCSSAEQLKISTAIGLSQNPTIRLMLIRDGSLLDDDSLAMLHTLAIEHDAQIIVERVGTGQPGEIVIEDGSVQA